MTLRERVARAICNHMEELGDDPAPFFLADAAITEIRTALLKAVKDIGGKSAEGAFQRAICRAFLYSALGNTQGGATSDQFARDLGTPGEGEE